LFIPFIENAFKHGVSNRGPSFLNVAMQVNPGEILFSCTNSLVNAGEDVSNGDSGIGLENVRKRLLLLYPNKHMLTINLTPKTFEVTLKIEMN
jgi:sensor histidine kinase YesM